MTPLLLPTGETGVLESVIRGYDPPGAEGRIQSGGHYNTTDGYTPPVGDSYLIPFDSSTALGQKQIAAQLLHEALMGARAAILEIAPEKVQAHVQRLLEFEAMAHWGNYVVAHMALTSAEFVEWVDKMLEGPTGGDTLQGLFESVHNITADKIPEEACVWVNPTDTSEVKKLGDSRNSSTQAGTGQAWFDGETVDLYDIDLGNGKWIRELTS